MNLILFEPEEAGKPLPGRDPRAIHLLKTLHKKPGDCFDAGILGGNRGRGRIEALGPGGTLEYTLDLREPPPPRYPLRAAIGFVRPIQIRRILRDLSSLGAGWIDLVGTDLGEKSYRETNLLADGGARASLIEGAVQARDTRIPALGVYRSLGDWLERRPGEEAGTEEEAGKGGEEPLRIALDNVRPQGRFSQVPAVPGRALVLAIGSERGWSDGERAALESRGFRRLSLGDRALRTETAGIAGVILGLEKMGVL